MKFKLFSSLIFSANSDCQKFKKVSFFYHLHLLIIWVCLLLRFSSSNNKECNTQCINYKKPIDPCCFGHCANREALQCLRLSLVYLYFVTLQREAGSELLVCRFRGSLYYLHSVCPGEICLTSLHICCTFTSVLPSHTIWLIEAILGLGQLGPNPSRAAFSSSLIIPLIPPYTLLL